jgi:hypothetical protein
MSGAQKKRRISGLLIGTRALDSAQSEQHRAVIAAEDGNNWQRRAAGRETAIVIGFGSVFLRDEPLSKIGHRYLL